MKPEPIQQISLRNDRKAGHFWVDNEIADCYQPIIGADAVWVYCRIARYAYGPWVVSPRLRGTNDTRVGLREMAEWCGKSVDTVWRCLQVLELVGLLQILRGPTKGSGRYAIADVKDLVIDGGGFYSKELASWCLPDARVAELKEQVRALRLKLARKNSDREDGPPSVAQSDSLETGLFAASHGTSDSSVAQSDSLGADSFSTPDAKCDRSVAPDVQICRSSSTDASRSITGNYKTTKTSTSPPTPPASGGKCVCEEFADDGTTQSPPAEVAAVFQRCSVDQPRHRDGPAALGAGTFAALVEPTPISAEEHARAPALDVGESPALKSEFNQEQLAHLAEHADDPEWTAQWQGYYREMNLAAARETAEAEQAARSEAARVERLQAEIPDIAAARAWVMRHCGFVDSGRKRGIGAVVEAVLLQERDVGKPPWETAPKMAEALANYAKNAEFIQAPYGPVNFFRFGIWRNSKAWRWDEKKLELARGARAGSYR